MAGCRASTIPKSMELTKAYIHTVKFEQKRGRYDAQEVDAFLERIAAEAERLQAELKDTKQQLEKYRSMETALTSVMVTAEANAKKVEEDAVHRAAGIVAEAQAEADRVRGAIVDQETSLKAQYEAERTALTEDVEKLRKFAGQYRSALREKIQSFLEQLQEPSIKQEALEGGIDLSDILKNLPETDSELKAMIDELI